MEDERQPEAGEIWRHKMSGKYYNVLGTGKCEVTERRCVFLKKLKAKYIKDEFGGTTIHFKNADGTAGDSFYMDTFVGHFEYMFSEKKE